MTALDLAAEQSHQMDAVELRSREQERGALVRHIKEAQAAAKSSAVMWSRPLWLEAVVKEVAEFADLYVPLVRPSSCFRSLWDGLMLLLLTYTSIVVPLEAAWQLSSVECNTPQNFVNGVGEDCWRRLTPFVKPLVREKTSQPLPCLNKGTNP